MAQGELCGFVLCRQKGFLKFDQANRLSKKGCGSDRRNVLAACLMRRLSLGRRGVGAPNEKAFRLSDGGGGRQPLDSEGQEHRLLELQCSGVYKLSFPLCNP